MSRHEEIAATGIREVVVFHSTVEELRQYEPDPPMAVIADPTKSLYHRFGVQSSARALANPRLWPTMPRVARNAMRKRGPRRGTPPKNPTGGRLGLPADFLISVEGRVIAVKYGGHAYDQWSVDELLANVPERTQAA